MPDVSQELLIIAKCLKPRGLKGHLAVFSYQDAAASLKQVTDCLLLNEAGERLRSLRIVNVSLQGKKVFVELDGLQTREAAAALTGHYLAIPRAEAKPLEADCYYIKDLQGLVVSDAVHGELGTIAAVLSQSSQELLQIQKPGAKDLYLPFLKAYLQEIDWESRRMQVLLPDGLYEIYRED